MNQIIEKTIDELERQGSRINLAIQVLKGLNGTRRGRPRKQLAVVPVVEDTLYQRNTMMGIGRGGPGMRARHAAKKKRHMSPEGRAAIRAGIQKRWAKYRKEHAKKAK